MKVLVVNFEYPPLGGGGGVATMHLAIELAKRDHEVHVLTTRYKGLSFYEFTEGVHIYRVPVWRRTRLEAATLISLITFVPMAWWKGWRLTRQIKFDVINAHFVVPSGLVAVLLSKIKHLPLVVTLIGGDVYDPSKRLSPHRYGIVRGIVRWICSQAQMVTAISQDTAERARRLHGVKNKIVVIPIGIARKATVPRLPRLDQSKLKAVTIGRLIPRKQYQCLLEAWKYTANIELTIIGSGPQENFLRGQAEKFDVSNRVHWAGFVSEEEKTRLLTEADIYVSAASHEGFGIVFLEACQAGLPIVATNVGGQLDFLQNEKNALLVPVHNSQALAEAVNRLVKDSELRNKMSLNNLQIVKDYFWDQLAIKFEAVLKEAKQIKV